MLMPSIFGENLFDDFMSDFPFFDDRDLRKTERKLFFFPFSSTIVSETKHHVSVQHIAEEDSSDK